MHREIRHEDATGLRSTSRPGEPALRLAFPPRIAHRPGHARPGTNTRARASGPTRGDSVHRVNYRRSVGSRPYSRPLWPSTAAPVSAFTKSPRRSGKAAWDRCIGRRTPCSAARSPRGSCRERAMCAVPASTKTSMRRRGRRCAPPGARPLTCDLRFRRRLDRHRAGVPDVAAVLANRAVGRKPPDAGGIQDRHARPVLRVLVRQAGAVLAIDV